MREHKTIQIKQQNMQISSNVPKWFPNFFICLINREQRHHFDVTPNSMSQTTLMKLNTLRGIPFRPCCVIYLNYSAFIDLYRVTSKLFYFIIRNTTCEENGCYGYWSTRIERIRFDISVAIQELFNWRVLVLN